MPDRRMVVVWEVAGAWNALVLGVVGCAGGIRDARVAELLTVTPDGRTLSVAVDNCNAAPVV